MAIELQIDFVVDELDRDAFESLYDDVYVPALRQQAGYRTSRLLRLYDVAEAESMGAEESPFDYKVCLEFQSEADRLRWVDTVEHGEAWRAVSELAVRSRHRGYHVVADDRRPADEQTG
jgi:heme-degrading monooxygenase HmoA